VLLAILRPRDPAIEPERAERNQEVLRIELTARTEATADVKFDQAHPFLRKAEQACQDPPVDVRNLRRAEHSEDACEIIDLGDEPPSLERHGRVATALDSLLDDERCILERPIDVAPLDREAPGPVRVRAFVDELSFRLDRSLRPEHNGERLVLDLDEVGGVLGRVPRLGDHDCNGLSGVAHDIACERMLKVVVQRAVREHPHGDRAKVGGEIPRSEDRFDARCAFRCGDVDGGDPGVRERAANDVGVECRSVRDVVDEQRRPAKERLVLLARR